MAEPGANTVRCPICKKPVSLDDPNVPFCSDRCRVIDLGKWASGGYVISSPIHDPDVLDELEGLKGRERSSSGDEE